MKISIWKMKLDLRTLSVLVLTMSVMDVGLAHTSLILSKRCGENTICKIYEYCSIQDITCRPCEQICDSGSHNYDETKCQQDCGEFIHDIQIGYARKSDIQSLTEEINKVLTLLVIILILLVVLITVVGIILGKRLHKWYRNQVHNRKLEKKKFQQKLSAVEYSISNHNLKREGSLNGTMRQSMRTNMPSTITLTTQAEESPVCTNKSTSTTKTLPLSIEEPCEDTTLDYAAYVNQALSHSPPSEVHLCPTKLDMS